MITSFSTGRQQWERETGLTARTCWMSERDYQRMVAWWGDADVFGVHLRIDPKLQPGDEPQFSEWSSAGS